MTVLYPYQEEGVKLLHKFKGRALLADEAGCGKSIQALTYLHDRQSLRPAIVVCPATIKFNWRKECKIHYNWRCEILSGMSPPRGFRVDENIIIVNYDILHPNKYGSGWLEFLVKLKPKIIIIDEAHYIGNRSTKRTKAVKALCQGVPHVIALTGTPLTNKPAELFPTLSIVRPDVFDDWRNYAWTHCAPERTPWGITFKGASRLGLLHRKLKKYLMIRRRKEDVLKDLPPKQRIVLPMEIHNRKEYEEAVRDFINWLRKTKPDKADKAARAEAVTKLGYLKRLAGSLKLPLVIRWVQDFLEESDGKLVLFGVHKQVIGELRNKFKKICVVIDGSTSQANRKTNIERFQEDPKVRLFIGNIKAAGVGITLTAASTLAFCELGWTPGEMEQGESRIERIGQMYPMSIYYLIAQNTIEEKLLELIEKKQKILSQTLDGAKKDTDFDIYEQLCLLLGKEKKKK